MRTGKKGNELRIKIVVTFFSVILVGIYLLNLCPTSIGTQRSKPEITNYNHYIENVSEAISFLVVFGLVQNNLETNIASVNITATFYDIENNSIETKVVPTSLEILKPGQKSPFQVYFLLNSSEEAPRYNLTLSYIETTEEPIEELEILNAALRPKVSKPGCYEVSGEVKNKGERKAWYVHMICIFFSDTGNVIDISHTYVAQQIGPNNKASFKLSSRPLKESTGEQIKNYELFITVGHYEVFYIQHYILLAIIAFATVGFIIYMKRYRDW